MRPWIQICTGQEVDGVFDYEHPELFTWPIFSIAHHLSMICRYTGASRRFYSVAEHCTRVALYAADTVRKYGGTIEDALMAGRYGHLHDASEMVYGDVNSPLKSMPYMAGYKTAEKAAHPLIAKRYNLHKVWVEHAGKKWDVVLNADLQALEFERAQLLGKPPLPWFPFELLPVVESNAFKGELGVGPAQAEADYLNTARILGLK